VGDADIVRLLVEGDSGGLAAVYDRYAQRLYDYCVGMLRDRDGAADAVHDALLVAADRARQLRDPEKLRPWLYAIARNECLRLLRARRREADLDAAGDIGDPSVDVERGLRSAEAVALVRDALAGLNPGDREVLDLTLRHELSGDELGAALGVPANHANALVSRARAQLERSVGALVMARTGQADCPELAQLLAGWDGELTALVRKRVSRHVERCAVCGEGRQRKVSAAALFASVPLAAIPLDLRRRVLDSRFDVDTVAHQREVGRRAEPFDRAGFPVPLTRQHRHPLVPVLAGAIALLMLIGAGALVWRGFDPDEAARVLPPSVAPTPSALPTSAAPASPTPSPSPAPSATPTTAAPTTAPPPPLTRSVSPTPTASPTPSPSPTPTPPVVVLQASNGTICGDPWTSGALATVSGGTAETVTVVWSGGTAPLTFLRGAWRGPVDGLPAGEPVALRAVATTAEGVEGLSNTVTVLNYPCPG
jgi:RNA polymerase sigma factor (sigma-70 family)